MPNGWQQKKMDKQTSAAERFIVQHLTKYLMSCSIESVRPLPIIVNTYLKSYLVDTSHYALLTLKSAYGDSLLAAD